MCTTLKRYDGAGASHGCGRGSTRTYMGCNYSLCRSYTDERAPPIATPHLVFYRNVQ